MSNSQHKIILFSEKEYKGKALVVFGEIKDFSEKLNNWNDKAKSIIVVKGHWKLRAGPSDSGEDGVVFSPDGKERGLYPSLEASLNKGVSSLVPI